MKTPNTEQVKELENAVIELLGTHEDCSHFSSTIQSVGEKYQPGPEVLEIFFFVHSFSFNDFAYSCPDLDLLIYLLFL